MAGDQTDKVVNSTGVQSSLYGGAANDILTGGSAKDTLTGGAGADVMKGMNGNDQLFARDLTSDTTINCDGGTTPGAADKADLDLLPKDPDSVVTAARPRRGTERGSPCPRIRPVPGRTAGISPGRSSRSRPCSFGAGGPHAGLARLRGGDPAECARDRDRRSDGRVDAGHGQRQLADRRPRGEVPQQLRQPLALLPLAGHLPHRPIRAQPRRARQRARRPAALPASRPCTETTTWPSGFRTPGTTPP